MDEVSDDTTSELPLDCALRYAAAGLSVLPIACDGSKQPPLAWKKWQEQIATESDIRRMFGGRQGIAIIGGKVSGNLETLDIDAPELVEPFEEAVRELAPGLLEALPTVATPRNNWGGRHYRYRIDGIVAGNTKLAQFLARETEKFGALIAEAERVINLLQERRTALISAAVTGKIDVRGLAQAEAA